MKRILFIVTMFVFALGASAQENIQYHGVGSNADFCAYQFDDENYIILSFKDDDENRLTNTPVLKLLLNDGTIIKLSGTDNSKKTRQSMTNWGFGIMSGSSSEKHYAMFYITPEEIAKLQVGVKKIAINTIPEVYKRSMKNDKLGKPLYDDFQKKKGDFEE